MAEPLVPPAEPSPASAFATTGTGHAAPGAAAAGAAAGASHAGARSDPAQAAPLRGDAVLRLCDHGLWFVSGADAASFLQAQLTAEVVQLGSADWRLAGYCSARGRLVAIAEIHRVDDGFLLLLERSRGTDLMARLRRFVLRAKVTFAEADAQWRVLGLLGEGAQARLGSTGLDLPGSDAPVAVSPDGSRVVRLPGAPALPRWLVLRPAAAAELPQLEGAAQEDPAAWTWGRIQAAIPLIHEGTVERFVPQSLNLECLDGVSFRKGCYPGQEVVARSQYLGKLRRRMALAHSPAAVVGEDIYAEGREEPVGRVVLAAPVPGGAKGQEHGGVTDLAPGDTQGGWDLLLECPADLPGSTQLRAGSPQAPALDMRPLPYPIFDPTA